MEPSSPGQKLRQVFKGLVQDLVWVLPGFPGLVLEVVQHPPHEPVVYFEVKLPREHSSRTGTPSRASGQRKPGERPPRASRSALRAWPMFPPGCAERRGLASQDGHGDRSRDLPRRLDTGSG